MIYTGNLTGDRIRWVLEEQPPNAKLTVVEAYPERRDWDVTDEAKRDEEAERLLGPIPEKSKDDIAWWIRPKDNSAILAVYRPWGPIPDWIRKVPSAVGEGPVAA